LAVSVVFFDVGNTLITPLIPEEQSIARFAANHGYQLDEAEVQKKIAVMYEYYERAYSDDSSFWGDSDRVRKIWIDMYRFISKSLGITEISDLLAEEIYSYYFSPEAWEPFADVLPTLEALKAEDLRLGTISNWDGTLSSILEGIGLAPYFDEIISSTDVGLHKPQADIFELACVRLGVSPHDALHIGDHISADALGAQAVGMKGILLDREDRYPDFDDAPRLKSLRDLPTLIDGFNNGFCSACASGQLIKGM
jgi:putative hydrolase of the HAD superfamily